MVESFNMNILLNYSQKKINVNQLYFRGQHLFIIMVIIIFGCKKNIKYKKNNLRDPIPTSAPAIAKPAQNFQIKNFFLPKKINGAQLTATIKSLESFNIGGHIGITINMYQGGFQDYYQFFICNRKSLVCSPKAQSPREFALSGHQYFLPPSGLVEVSVRACIRTERALNASHLCGKYTTDSITLSPSANEKITNLLTERRNILDNAKKECFDFFDKTLAFNEIFSKDLSLSKTVIAKALKKQHEVGKDMSCELVYSPLFDEILENAEEIQKNADDEKNKSNWTPKSITLLSLGTISVLAGSVFIAKSAGYDFRSLFRKTKLGLTETNDSSLDSRLNNSHKGVAKAINIHIGLASKSIKDEQHNAELELIEKIYRKQSNLIKKNKDLLSSNLEKLREAINNEKNNSN